MDEERVEYSFTGDVSDLKAATKEAISLLDQYEGTVKGLAKSGDLEVGKTAFTSFQRTVNGIIKQVNSLSGFMNKASQENQNALVPNTEAIESAYSGISDALNFLQTSTKVTTDDLKLITLVLQDTKNVLDLRFSTYEHVLTRHIDLLESLWICFDGPHYEYAFLLLLQHHQTSFNILSRQCASPIL